MSEELKAKPDPFGVATRADAIAKSKTVLIELESLVLFDQSQSSKWPRVTINIDSSGAVVIDNEATLIVYPNGRTYSLERAVDIPLPPEVIDALQAAITARMVRDKGGNGYVPKDVMRFPFRVVDAMSQRRYDQWKNALEVLRVVVTETKKTRHHTMEKDVYTVIARYLPEEVVAKARDIIVWANNEIQAEKDKAVELRAAAA